MENNVSRILIETIVKKTLKEIKDSPERSVRNLVDMALNFSKGRFQYRFFEAAQTMLKNENSPYYALIRDTVAHVDTEHLAGFGMNLGYNGCTMGAKKIRAIEEAQGFNIPWSVSLCIDAEQFPAHQEQYHRVIDQGEAMGIYTWLLFVDGAPHEILTLPERHSDSAFIVFATPPDIIEPFLDGAGALHNLMLAIRLEETAPQICALAQEKGLLYSVYHCYGAGDTQAITSGELFRGIERMHPVFTILISDPGCPDGVRREVYEYVQRARNEQLFQTLPWEAAFDGSFVDSIISQDACSAGFDEDGWLMTLYEKKPQECLNLFHNNLPLILQRAFPTECGI